jgi:hypothetical protein
MDFGESHEELIAISEVPVDRPAGHARALGHLFQCRPLVALFSDELAGGIQKFGARASALVSLGLPSTALACGSRLAAPVCRSHLSELTCVFNMLCI